jgi:hypothetical protein
MDEKSGRSMKDYARKLDKSFDQMVPWQRDSRRLAHMRGKVKSGEVVVLLEDGDTSKNPLFKDAKTKRER